MRRSAALFAVLGALFAGACSDNTSQVQDQISSQIKSETGVQDAKVTCPSDIKGTKGEKFNCTATGNFTDFLAKQGVTATLKSVTFNVEFVEDKKFSASVDTGQLQSDFSAADASASSTSSSSP